MKTTLDIADPLLRKARKVAARERTTLRALVEQGLRQVMLRRSGGGLSACARQASRDGVGDAGWERLRDLAHEGRGGLIAVDTNVLVYAHQADSAFHRAAERSVAGLAETRRETMRARHTAAQIQPSLTLTLPTVQH
jgi:hypothetical protein